MLRTRPPILGPRLLGQRRASRATVRLPVPEPIVAVVGFGSEHPAAVGEGFWAAVEDELAAFVQGQLPPGAADVNVTLDERLTELVLSYRRPLRGTGSDPAAP